MVVPLENSIVTFRFLETLLYATSKGSSYGSEIQSPCWKTHNSINMMSKMVQAYNYI